MRWPTVVAALALVVVAGAAWAILAEPAVEQPIRFPHKTHVEMNLECTSCHDRAEKDAVAGRPATALCLSCHAGGDASGELKKVQAFEKGGEIPWRRVWRLPPHVNFSHRVHVVAAKIACQTCHGPMQTLDRPPSRPLKKLSMAECIGCHEARRPSADRSNGPLAAVGQRALATDCNACHH